jgi:hypothetical protein
MAAADEVGARSGLDRRRAVLWTLTLEAALTDITRAFREQGIQFLLLKGLVFARWLYADPYERRFMDLDLLIRPEDFAAARSALAELGCSAPRTGRPAAEHHEIWTFVTRGSTVPDVQLELHHTLWGVPAPPTLVWERLSENAEVIDVRGASVAVPSSAGCALIVGLHAAQHGMRSHVPIDDLRRALTRVDQEVWREAATLANQLGAGGQFGIGLRLDRAGCVIADQLRLTTASSRRVRLHASTPPDVAVGLERLLTTPGVKARLKLLAAEVFPPPAFMRTWRPVARRGRWGLVLAYAWRPVWLVLMLPRAGRAWLRAATS